MVIRTGDRPGADGVSIRVLRKIMNMEHSCLHREREEGPSFHGIIGNSLQMQTIFRLIERVANTPATVLIEGENGTGKELIAQAIHSSSSRKDRRFVTVDCGSLSETLTESELFGHRKGSFTDAKSDKPGLFDEAEGGTIFLDEISSMNLSLQNRLLRVLQESEIRSVGETRYRKIDVRVIAATNRNLFDEIGKGRFREDLYYRLNVMPIKIPPLRARKEDIPLLVAHFIEKQCWHMGKHPKILSREAMEVMTLHDWPGNVRELENAVARAVILCTERSILPKHLPSELQHHRGRFWPEKNVSLGEAIRNFKKQYIEKILSETGGHQGRAARRLGIQRTYLNRMLNQWKEDENG